MKNKYNTINISNKKEKQRLNPNLISHLFFQFKDNGSNKFKKTRNKNNEIKQNSSKKGQIRNNFINKIMTETNYVYKESNIENKDNSNVKYDIFYMKMNSTDKINKEYFPIQQFNKSIYIPKIIKIKKNYHSEEKNKTNNYNDEEILFQSNKQKQYIKLKGEKNLTYKYRFINKPNYFSFQNISLGNIHNKKENYIKNLYNYELTIKFLNNNKKKFKI